MRSRDGKKTTSHITRLNAREREMQTHQADPSAKASGFLPWEGARLRSASLNNQLKCQVSLSK